MARRERRHPRQLVADWPRPEKSRVAIEKWEGVSDKPHDERLVAPARATRQIVINLRDAMGESSIREVAELCGLDHSQVLRILNGELWPDAISITKLEDGLGVDLWPRRLDR